MSSCKFKKGAKQVIKVTMYIGMPWKRKVTLMSHGNKSHDCHMISWYATIITRVYQMNTYPRAYVGEVNSVQACIVIQNQCKLGGWNWCHEYHLAIAQQWQFFIAVLTKSNVTKHYPRRQF